MVGFGQSLQNSRREGWEDAYLDYERLKEILNRMELEWRQAEGDDSSQIKRRIAYTDFSKEFASELQQEIEKVLIFSLSRIGDVANAVGALRCMGRKEGETGKKVINDTASVDDVEDGKGFNFDEFGERGSLLPSSDTRSYSHVRSFSRRSGDTSDELFSREKLVSFVGHQINFDKQEDIHQVYSELGVELLHLLKFNCLNSVGIRKIVKKREKFHQRVSQDLAPWQQKSVVFEDSNLNTIFFLPDQVSSQFNSARDDRLHQLGNYSSLVALYDSLLEALVDCEAQVLRSWTIALPFSEPIVFSKESAIKFLQESRQTENGLSLLRFECTVSSIHALIEFARDVHKPFLVWLSRKALIDTGNDHGDIGRSDEKALKLLLLFEPDFILHMTESELYDWYRRVTAEKSGHKRHPTFMEYAVGEKDWGGVNTTSLVINLMSTLLYTVNYYIIAPTANHYATLLGTNGAFGATLIGMSSFSAMFSAFLYSVWYTRSTFKSGLIFSALCPFVGNLMYSLAISYHSMKLALVGRLLCGLGSAEVINRQLISACVSYQHMTKASALFVSVSAIGMSIGPLIAAVLDILGGRDVDIDIRIPLPGKYSGGIVFDHCTDPGWLMCFLWLVHLLSLLFLFTEPERINSVANSKAESCSETIWSRLCSFVQLICGKKAFLVTLYLFAFIELSGEVLISSCSMIVHRYFDWHGSRAGFIIASLGALVLPAHYIVEHASRHFSERAILKASILFVFCSTIAICNLEGLILDIAGAILKSEDTDSDGELWTLEKQVNHTLTKHKEFPYDWGAGIFVYLISLSAIFVGAIVMEGVNTSLMSKCAPRALDGFVNVGLLATLVGTMGRVVGDSMITISAFVGKAQLHDFVSVTFLPMVPLIVVGYLSLKRYYDELLI